VDLGSNFYVNAEVYLFNIWILILYVLIQSLLINLYFIYIIYIYILFKNWSDDTEYIYMNIGYGFHAQLKLDEAQKYIEKKNQLLEK